VLVSDANHHRSVARGWEILTKVKLLFNAGQTRIHYLFDAPELFCKQAIMLIEP
jgi:hypothetical protein